MTRAKLTAFLFIAACAQGQMKLKIDTQSTEYKLGQPILLSWKLTNDSNQEWAVRSHYATPAGNHYDFLTLHVRGPFGNRRLRLSGERTSGVLFTCGLSPANLHQESADLTTWARIYDFPLTAGTYSIDAEYSVSLNNNAETVNAPPCASRPGQPQLAQPLRLWSGRISSNSIKIEIR